MKANHSLGFFFHPVRWRSNIEFTQSPQKTTRLCVWWKLKINENTSVLWRPHVEVNSPPHRNHSRILQMPAGHREIQLKECQISCVLSGKALHHLLIVPRWTFFLLAGLLDQLTSEYLPASVVGHSRLFCRQIPVSVKHRLIKWALITRWAALWWKILQISLLGLETPP